jgi:hypothetical protein
LVTRAFSINPGPALLGKVINVPDPPATKIMGLLWRPTFEGPEALGGLFLVKPYRA